MNRQSALNDAPGRQSTFNHGPNHPSSSSSTNLARMVAAKKREYESSAALEHNSLKLKQTFLAFLRQMELAGEGADGVGRVLANWPQMFSIIASFSQGVASASTGVEDSQAEFQAAQSSLLEADDPPEPLVRIELAKLDN